MLKQHQQTEETMGQVARGGMKGRDRQAQVQRTQRSRALHDRRRVLLLPNAWDAGSARVVAARGFDAIATTSTGVAWSLGHADGEEGRLAEVVAAIGRPFPDH